MKDSYNRLKEKSGEMLFDIITDIPESLLSPAKTPQKRCELLTRKAAANTAAAIIAPSAAQNTVIPTNAISARRKSSRIPTIATTTICSMMRMPQPPV